MVMSTSEELESVEEPILRQIEPKPFRWDAIDAEKVVISYDRRSDTLLVHLFGQGRSSISVPVERYLYAMVDPESEQSISVRIEGFLSQAVKEHPWEIMLLDYAELRGITPIEVRAMQRKEASAWRKWNHSGQRLPTKQEIVARMLAAEKMNWGISGTSAA